MVLIPLTAVLAILLGVWCFITDNISLNVKNARLCRWSMLAISTLGALGALAIYIIYNVTVDREAFTKESFNFFCLLYVAFILLCIVVTVVAYFLRTKLRRIIVILLSLWGILAMLFAYAGAVWLSYSDKGSGLLVAAFGICAAATLAFPAFLEISERVKVLSDRKKREEIIAARRLRRMKADMARTRRKALSDKKKKLRNPGR